MDGETPDAVGAGRIWSDGYVSKPRHRRRDGSCRWRSAAVPRSTVGPCVHLWAVCAVAASLLASGCIPSKCYADKDCPSGSYCTDGGDCKKRCSVEADCPLGSYCHSSSGRCVEKQCDADSPCTGGGYCSGYKCVECLVDKNCSEDQVCYFGRCVATPERCECVMTPPFCAEDRNPHSVSSTAATGELFCIPEKLGNGALFFFGSVG